jgi:hypothetical protein
MAEDTSEEEPRVLSARVSPELAEEVEAYADEQELSRSEAIARLTETGLEVSHIDHEAHAVLPTLAAGLGNVDEEMAEMTDEMDRLSRNVSTVYRYLKELDLEKDPSEQFDGEW